MKLEPFPTYTKSETDDFENIFEKIWKISINTNLIIEKFKNILAEGGIAIFEQFRLLSLCNQKSSAAEASESIYMRVSVKFERQ